MKVDIVAEYTETKCFGPEDESTTEWEHHCIVKCNECGSLTYCIYYSNSDDWEEYVDSKGRYAPRPCVMRIGYYPCAKFPQFREGVIDKCPKYIKRIISEGYIAYQNELYTLASVSLRMVIDAICRDAKARGQIRKAFRSELQKNGYITEKQLEILENIVNNANDAAHSFVSLEENELESAFAILAILIESLYIIPSKSAQIRITESKRR